MASWNWPAVVNKILSDVPGIKMLLTALLKQDPAGTTDVPAGAKRWTDTPEGKQFQNFNGSEWQSVGKLAHDAASVDGHSASTDTTPNTIPVRGADGKIPGDISGNAASATRAKGLSETLLIDKGGTGGTTVEQARQNLGVAPTDHASSGMDYGIGTENLYGHVKAHDAPDTTLTAASGHAFSPAGAAAMLDVLEGQLGDLAGVVSGNAAAQSAKDAEQDEAIEEALNRMSMPIGMVFPFTGKDVPAGTLRADGATYTNMQASFPDFYEWVKNLGLTVPLASYALVEGSCGYYGLDEATGTVRMPTLAAGVFGADAASKYGQAVEAGLPNITGTSGVGRYAQWANSDGASGALYHTVKKGLMDNGDNENYDLAYLSIDASRSSTVYGKSDTVTPVHVKYPWVIVVYNAAVPPSVAEAGEFIELLDGKADKATLGCFVPTGAVIAFAANKEPEGFLLCNGAEVSRTTYAALFAEIGTTYGAGDGSTTFNLPDTRGKVIEGLASTYVGKYFEAGLPNITGLTGYLYRASGSYSGALYKDSETSGGSLGGGDGTWAKVGFKASSSNSIYGKSSTVQPPSVVMRYFIKY